MMKIEDAIKLLGITCDHNKFDQLNIDFANSHLAYFSALERVGETKTEYERAEEDADMRDADLRFDRHQLVSSIIGKNEYDKYVLEEEIIALATRCIRHLLNINTLKNTL